MPRRGDIVRASRALTVLAIVLAAAYSLPASPADEPPPLDLPADLEADPAPGPADGPLPAPPDLPPLAPLPLVGPPGASAEPREFPPEARPRAVVRVEGTPAPGLQITLDAEGSEGEGLNYRWIQTDGPPVTLDDPQSRRARLTVPEGAGEIGFVLVVGNSAGIDSAAVSVPVELRGRQPVDQDLQADAGDDQVGMVGRQVTLNGSRSEPRGRIGYRWVQMSGPRVRLKMEDGYIYSFVPTAPGLYRFALVVATGGRISEPDAVSVTVAAALPSSPEGGAAGVRPETVEAIARSALASLDGGPAVADDLGDAFEAIAQRMDLYGSYAEAFQELSRRLDVIVPVEPARRDLWAGRIFAPLTARMIEAVRLEGLDLGQPAGQSAPLNENQRARLAEQFRSMSEGFRAARPAPR